MTVIDLAPRRAARHLDTPPSPDARPLRWRKHSTNPASLPGCTARDRTEWAIEQQLEDLGDELRDPAELAIMAPAVDHDKFVELTGKLLADAEEVAEREMENRAVDSAKTAYEDTLAELAQMVRLDTAVTR